MNELLKSSTGQGTKLRIKAFIALLIPVLNELLKDKGVVLMPEEFEMAVDVFFWLLFGGLEIWGWVRAYLPKNYN